MPVRCRSAYHTAHDPFEATAHLDHPLGLFILQVPTLPHQLRIAVARGPLGGGAGEQVPALAALRGQQAMPHLRRHLRAKLGSDAA